MGFFDGKVVWITGASSGIGRALSRALAAEGARLVLSARSAAELKITAQDCLAVAGGDAPLILAMDVTDAEARADAYRQVLTRLGRVDILFNNAGVAQRASALETSLEVVRHLMEVNFFACVAMAKLVLPDMVARASGQIVLTSSIGGKFGAPMRSTYAASKHALHGWFEALRIEHQADGVGVTFLVIGSVQTDIVKNALTATGQPLGETDDGHLHGMRPEDFAALALAGVSRGDHEVFIGSAHERRLADLKRSDPDALTAELSGLYAPR